MNLLLPFMALLMIAAAPGASFAERVVIDSKTAAFENSPQACWQTKSCALKRAEMLVQDVVRTADFGNGSEQTRRTILRAGYETTSLGALEDFAFVQSVRGCVFHSHVDERGLIQKRLHSSVASFGQSVMFRFPNWVLDSPDKDPVYGSREEKPGGPRQYTYLWGTPMDSDFSWENTPVYGEKKPPTPFLMVADIPSGAYTSPLVLGQPQAGVRAKNVSLEFRICLYRTRDIPRTTTRDDLNFAAPIHCFEWDSSFIYDHASAQYRSPVGIDAFCSEDGPAQIISEAPAVFAAPASSPAMKQLESLAEPEAAAVGPLP